MQSKSRKTLILACWNHDFLTTTIEAIPLPANTLRPHYDPQPISNISICQSICIGSKPHCTVMLITVVLQTRLYTFAYSLY